MQVVQLDPLPRRRRILVGEVDHQRARGPVDPVDGADAVVGAGGLPAQRAQPLRAAYVGVGAERVHHDRGGRAPAGDEVEEGAQPGGGLALEVSQGGASFLALSGAGSLLVCGCLGQHGDAAGGGIVPDRCVCPAIRVFSVATWASRVVTRVVRASRAAWVTTTSPLKVRAFAAFAVRGRSAVSPALRQAMLPCVAFGSRRPPTVAVPLAPTLTYPALSATSSCLNHPVSHGVPETPTALPVEVLGEQERPGAGPGEQEAPGGRAGEGGVRRQAPVPHSSTPEAVARRRGCVSAASFAWRTFARPRWPPGG